MSVTTLLFTKNNPNLLADTMSLGKILVEQLGNDPSPFASKAAVLETACAPYTTAQ